MILSRHVKALNKVLPKGKAVQAPTAAREFFLLERTDDVEAMPESTSMQSTDDVFEAVAENNQMHDCDYEDALDIFETYIEIRKRMQAQKVSRGFRGPMQPLLQLHGIVQARIQIKDKTLCHICMRLGHGIGKGNVLDVIAKTTNLAVEQKTLRQKQMVMKRWWQTRNPSRILVLA